MDLLTLYISDIMLLCGQICDPFPYF